MTVGLSEKENSMNERQIQYFLEIVNQGGISNAAHALYVSTSSLCQTVSKLEAELGAELFTHKRGNYHLTNAGKQFYEFATHASQSYRQLMRNIGDMDESPSGELSISMSVKRAASLLPIFLPSYMEKYPSIRIKAAADMLTVDEREQLLLMGKCDFIINSYHDHHTDCELEYVNIGTERMMLLMGKNTELAERLIRSGEVPKYVYLQDIADASFLLPPPIYGGRYMIDQMFSALGKKPHVLAQISPINASKSLVETGQYCTLSPELMSPPYAYESKYYTIPVLLSNDSNGLCERPIYMVYRKEIPLVSFQRAFIQIACSLCGGIIPS